MFLLRLFHYSQWELAWIKHKPHKHKNSINQNDTVPDRISVNNMADERLAELVQSYPIPYDKSLVDLKNIHKKELARSEIARELSLKSGKQKYE